MISSENLSFLWGVLVFCGETIIPKGTRGSQLSFKFTIRNNYLGGKKMKKLTASIVAGALMISAMGINAFAANRTPEIKVYGNSVATANGNTVNLNVRMSNFAGVAGMDLTIEGTGVTLGTPASSEIALVEDSNYKLEGSKLHIVELNAKKDTLNIKIPATVIGYEAGTITVTSSKLAANGKKLLTEKTEYSVDNANGSVAVVPKEETSDAALADGADTFIPYGSVYTGENNFVTKDKDGKFAATTGAKYTAFKKPANNILTYGVSENTKADGKNNNLQFGTYSNNGNKSQGTMLLVGDWNAYLEKQIKEEGKTAEQVLTDLYGKEKVSGKKYAEITYGANATDKLLVYKIERTTYLWRNQDNQTFEYALRVKNYAGKECTAVGYYVDNDAPVFSGQLKSSTALG